MATTTADVRAWAKTQNFDVGERGRIPAEIVQAYERATGGKDATAKATGPAGRNSKPATASRATASPSRPPAQPVAEPGVSHVELERRVADLECQIAALTERLDGAVKALAKRGGTFRLSRKK